MNKIFSISEIADLNKNNITSKDNFEYINYLDTSNLTRNKIDNIQYMESNFPSRAKRKVSKNTILYSTVRPNQEHFGIIESNLIENLIVSTGFTTIDLFSPEIDVKYLYYKITQPSITKYLQNIAENSVSAYPSIKPEEIGKLNFRFPNLPNQKKNSFLFISIR
ncbi:restriction endonuclease subunit S [Chryseobacterium proteolyticum]|uniref:restriction endonuclease subunit S n=1 Tax=Chryseobacterium proteolyticum TaxID=118127 RepID=UPI003983BDE5